MSDCDLAAPANYAALRIRTGRKGGRTIAAQYGSSTGGQKRQYFGRVDPFCLFAVVPILVIAGLFFWSDIAFLGVILVVIAILIVVFDSWANRPLKRSSAPPRRRDEY
ncbi:hypothetical protein [Actinophytocola sp. NPDC049390]|uniref:hypothetical protein n=1 Tax=Actinophytocola sp. NPDC049390 TaxID=3363894 RepID=UPI003790C117